MILAKIDVLKLDKSRFFRGQKGTYADLVLVDSPDPYGNDGFIAQSVSKEERERGEKGAIVGSFRRFDKKT
jgi:hypothetical protein